MSGPVDSVVIDRMMSGRGGEVNFMGLDIENDEARQLAQELAESLLALGKDCAGRLKEPFRATEHGDLLYDERGLPK